VLQVDPLVPSDAIATATATVVVRGQEFTDSTRLTVGGTLVPTSACDFFEANAMSCELTHPMPGAGMAERVDVLVETRSAHGQSVTLQGGFTWTVSVNETDGDNEADYCVLQHPATESVGAGLATVLIFGRIFEAGMTDVTSGAHPSITAELGYGPPGTSPAASNAWRWVAAAFNTEYGNNDEYMATLTVGTAGTYAYTLRFSLDGGLTWTYADLDGAGSDAGVDFDAANLGVLTVTP